MRLHRIIGIAALALGFTGSAGATDVPKGKADSSGPSVGGSGGSVGSAGSGNSSSATAGATSAENVGLLEVRSGKQTGKWWEVGGTWETHGLFVQSDLQGAARSKLFNFAYFYARADVTKYDRLSLRGGFYQFLLSDQAESGVRATDLVLAYTRLVPLPGQVELRLIASVSAPISYYSQRAGTITSPTGTIELSRRFGRLSLDGRVFGGGTIARKTTSQGYDTSTSTVSYGGGIPDQQVAPGAGSNPNAKGVLGGLLEADYKMWFHEALSVGADVYTAYLWYYDVSKEVGGQPIQQVYGGEVFVRYNLPTFYGFKTDLTVAAAVGDPTLGYPSVIYDGIHNIYGPLRQTAEMYGALSVRY